MALRKKHLGGAPSRGWDLPDVALSHALRDFLAWSEAVGISPFTVRQRQRAVRRFILWAVDRTLTQPQDITLPILDRYQRHLYHYRKKDGTPLSFASQHTELVPLKAYFKWLARERRILYNPASELVMPKAPRQIPRYVLTVEEVERIIGEPDTATLVGVRDRAMLEVLYSSGIRRNELAHLEVVDVDTRRGSLLVREGKGRKDRLVPLGERACRWVDKYLIDVRPELLATTEEGRLFLTDYGEAFDADWLGEYVKRYIQRAGILVPGACHLFRHACATHMLENGADIRYIQALLGHSSLTSTQIYTNVSIQKLKEIHAATHPARLTRVRGDVTAVDSEHPADERTALLAALELEETEDADGVAADVPQAARR
jgi:integrase/recombinase XerD